MPEPNLAGKARALAAWQDFAGRSTCFCVPSAMRTSSKGERFAFENIGAESVELWVGEAKTGVAKRIPNARLNPMLDDP